LQDNGSQYFGDSWDALPTQSTPVQEPDLIARLKHPEDHYKFTDPKKVNAVLMSLCQEAADALAAPVQETVAWSDKIIGMEVSMDVSTGDDDIDHRVYGQVYEVMLAYDGGPDVILAIESERNFTTPPAQPAPVQSCYCQNCEALSKELAAQRQWVGLTDEEMQALWDRYAHMEMMRSIEAKLKELNT
jgi:hypothetical protein